MTKHESGISIELLHRLFEIDKKEGRLFWKPRDSSLFWPKKRSAEHACANWNSRYAGKPALNSVDGSGHLTGRIFDKLFHAHRVIFAMDHGVWPTGSIDHINGDPSDNRPENLRDVTHQENHRNQRLRKNNTSGSIGVNFNKARNKWQASIMVDYKAIHLGFFLSKEAAIEARESAQKKYGFHANHGEVTS